LSADLRGFTESIPRFHIRFPVFRRMKITSSNPIMPALRASVWWFYKHADPTGLCLVVSVHSTNMPALRTGLCLVVSAHSTNMPALRAYDWWFPCILQTCQPCILQICRPYGPLSTIQSPDPMFLSVAHVNKIRQNQSFSPILCP